VVSTFLASYEVIEKAVALDANLIVTHEPIFYNHLDESEWLRGDSVYEAKRRLIDDQRVVLWRFHDYLHMLRPDATVMGLVEALGWTTRTSPEKPYFCRIPPTTLRGLVRRLKRRLDLDTVRIVGDGSMNVRGVLLSVGAPGGRAQIDACRDDKVDVLVCGEINEWEISEYIRDARRLGQRKALIVIGHAESEEKGMEWIVPWIQERLPGTPVTFVPVGPCFRYL